MSYYLRNNERKKYLRRDEQKYPEKRRTYNENVKPQVKDNSAILKRVINKSTIIKKNKIPTKIQNDKGLKPENKQYNTNTNMSKKFIRLTEEDLHRIVKESVNRVLRESLVFI